MISTTHALIVASPQFGDHVTKETISIGDLSQPDIFHRDRRANKARRPENRNLQGRPSRKGLKELRDAFRSLLQSGPQSFC